MSTSARRWTEQQAPPPTDLRLALPALAVWAGCLVGLWATPLAWWLCGAVAGSLAVCAYASLRWHRRMAGVVGVLVCLGAATGVAALTMHVARIDPLFVAADAGGWATVELTVAADPVPIHDGVGAVGEPMANDAAGVGTADALDGRAGAGTVGGNSTRWRIAGHAHRGLMNGHHARSSVAVTVFAAGFAWGSVTTGETIRAEGTLAPDTFFTVPGVTLRARGDPEQIADAPFWQEWATSARAALSRSAAALDDDPGGLLRGVVVGDTRGMSTRLATDAKITGLSHLVAVSGTHMAIVSGAVMLLLRRFGPRVSAAGVGAALVGMVVLVGPSPSVLRSAVMGLIGVAALAIGRSRSALPALSAAVGLLLLFDPELAVSVGFALSVQATAGLVLLAPPWTRALERRGVPRGWAVLIVFPVVAHLVTMPVIAAISGRISLVAIPANMVVTPVVAPTLLLGLVCLVASICWPDAGRVVAHLDSPLLQWITGTAHHLAHWPSAAVPWPASTAGVLTLAGMVLVGLAVLRHRYARAAVAAMVVGALVVVVPARVAGVGWPVSGWLLTACEVGQGDGMVLATGNPGQAVVVDTGPDPTLMDACLDRLGIHAIPLLVLTHLHADHVDGLAGAMRGRSVGAIAMGPDRFSPPTFRAIERIAARHRTPVIASRPGESWQIGTLHLTVLGPLHTFHGTDSDPNNDSVVMLATRDGVRMLMTGDIERPAQRALLRSGVDLHADVLKQPHHGSSKLLPQFVAAVSPRIAVIGVGAHNDYGHPAESALQTDRAAGVARILRTDEDGDVQVCWTGNGLATAERGAHLRSSYAPVG